MEILSRKVVTAFLTLVLCLLLSQTVRADSAGTTEPVVTSPSTTENKEKITSETHTSTEVV